MSPEPSHILQDKLLHILQQHPQGLCEHDLLKLMRDDLGLDEFETLFHDQLQLFQVHFILFHLLYDLRDKLFSNQLAHLEINTMRIKLTPYSAGRHALGRLDAMRAYYLDLNNLRDTTAEDIDTMLDKFWQAFLAIDERELALSTLELADPVDFDTIKSQYRKLCMKHHPDRDGDVARFQAVNQAMKTLKKFYPD